MKLLFVSEFFPANKDLVFTGGVEAYNFYLVRELAKSNNVTVICRSSENYKKKIFQGCCVIGIKSPGRVDSSILSIVPRLSFIFKSINLGMKEDFDLIQGNNFVSYPIAFLLGVFKKKPVIAWYPDVFIGRWFKLAGILSGFVGEIIERMTVLFPWAHFIALSNSTKNKLLKVGIKEEKISTIYAGVDIEFFKSIRTTKKPIFTISCVSRFVGYKRLDLLIKASKAIIDKGVEIRVEIIGDGPLQSKIRSLITEYKLEKSVFIKSNLPRYQLGKVIKSSNLFCLTSQEEGFGLVVLEAAACGIPFVVSDLPVLEEITRRKGGLFFKSGNEKDLESRILEFIQNKKLQTKLKKETEILANSYNWKDISQQFLAIYSKILKKRLKILMLTDAWFPHVGGGQVHVWELSKKLAEKGCEVTIFTRNLGEWYEEFPGVSVKRVGNFRKFANMWGRIEYLLYALVYGLIADYDILHAHAFSPGVIAYLIKLFRKKPIVFTVHGKGVKIAGLNMDGIFLEDLVVYKIPYDLEITVAKKTITKKTKAKKLTIIPNGVNLEEFKSAQKERKIIKKMLYVGRLSYEKGVDLLIDAFKRLNTENQSLSIIGEGDQLQKLKVQAKKLKIFFLGNLQMKALTDEYKKADLLILPSRTEGQPLVLFEAWAAKLPVLATKVGDNERYIKEDQTGFLAEPNSESLGKSLKKILISNKLVPIQENAYKIVQEFSWEKIAKKTLNHYRKIL